MSLILIVGLGSCGVNRALILNQNQNTTHVQLSKNNFKLIGEVSGSSEVKYVLIFGGASKSKLFNDAYTEMLTKAELDQGARTLVNVLTEEQLGGVPPFYYSRRVTVTANVIEFTQ